PSCTSKPAGVLADAARRKEFIEALVTNPATRAEVIDRLVGPPGDRAAVIERILKDESAAGDLVAKIIQQDRGKAIVASKIAADPTAKTFIRMLMLTGVMGESMTQQQATLMGLGEPFSYGSDGKDDELGKVAPTQSYDCDIVFSDGDFIQWPGWIRKHEVR